MNKLTFRMFTVAVALLWVSKSLGQEKTPYYFSLNSSLSSNVHDVEAGKIHIQYHDAFGRWKQIPLKVFNWKQELVSTLDLDKSFGLNSYSIDLGDIVGTPAKDEIFTFQLTDESGKNYVLSFRVVPPPEFPLPVVNITVNPTRLECDGLSANVVEFYGEVQGGKAPYTITWYVLDAQRNNFLYQPREEHLKSSGKTPFITVDKNPEYYVVLSVTDACGNVSQKAVSLVCEEKRKRINSIFIDELNSLLIPPPTNPNR